MKIKWYGHAAFKITTDDGVRVIIDPYESGAFGGALSYGKITDEADIVLTSHDHEDHNYVKDIKGSFRHFNKEGRYREKGLTIEAIPCFHDPSEGKERGNNLIFVIEADGLRVVHTGDLGHALTQDIRKKIGRTDVLLLPVGGFYTVDADEASTVMADLNPSVTVPMHFRTPKCDFPMAEVESFTAGKKGVKSVDGAEFEITIGSLPRDPEIVVLKYAL